MAISEYGLNIYNYQAGSVYAVMNGARNNYHYHRAMLTNSLFLDFLSQNGLKVSKNGYTRDVIGVEFDYGSRSADEELEHLEKLKTKEDTSSEALDYFEQLSSFTEDNRDKFVKKSADEIREEFYVNGLDIVFKEGGKSKKVHYVMLYRTPGKAKKGTCMFIRQGLYKKAREFLYMGIKLPKKNAPIVEIGAYSSLVTSTIIDRIQINPEDVLVLNDIKSEFVTKVISVELDEHKHCVAVEKDNYTVTNELFDGQALIDLSIFPDYGNGYVLLRQHFTKCAAFATNIQQFFKDYFGDKYDEAVVTDMWGNTHLAKNIKLITTNNAIKWLKFDGITYEYWSEWVHKNGCLWGVVKTAHPSKFGDVQRMSYQMVNALSEEVMADVCRPSIEYIESMKKNTNVFIDYLKKNANFANDFDVLVALYEQDHTFEQCEYFRNRKNRIVYEYTQDIRSGHILQNADNLTIVGSPYAMLLHSVGENVEDDPTLVHEDGTIQCYTERFEDGEYLAFMRSPYNSQGNMVYLHNNRSHPYWQRYFEFGKLIVAVNVLHTDMQDRANGCDFDSDSGFVTNHSGIVAHAKYCYEKFPTIVNNIPKEKNIYDSTLKDFAVADNSLAAAQLAIGESSNLAQLILSYSYNFDDRKYQDYVSILSVLAQCAIDNAKRKFDVDLTEEIKRIKADANIKENKYPEFWKIIKPSFRPVITRVKNGERIKEYKVNRSLSCPMNYLSKVNIAEYHSELPTLPVSDFFVKYQMDDRKKSKKIEKMIQEYAIDFSNFMISEDSDIQDLFLLRKDFDSLVKDIQGMVMPSKYVGLMSWLVNRAFICSPQTTNNHRLDTLLDKNKARLMKVLYTVNPEALLKVFSKNVCGSDKV